MEETKKVGDVEDQHGVHGVGLLGLPREVVGMVLVALRDDADVLRFGLACAAARAAVVDDFLWRQRALRYLPSWVPPDLPPHTEEGWWRRFYRERKALKDRWCSGSPVKRLILEGHLGSILAACPLQGGELTKRAEDGLATVSDQALMMWKTNGRCIGVYQFDEMLQSFPLLDACIERDRGGLALLTKSSLEFFWLHDPQPVRALATTIPNACCMSSVLVHRDACWVAGANNDGLVLMEVGQEKNHRTGWHHADPDAEAGIAFIELCRPPNESDGPLVVCIYRDTSVSVWDGLGVHLFRIHGDAGLLASRQVMQDRGWLLLGTYAGSIEVFDLWEGKHLQSLVCNMEAILCLMVHGDYIAAGSQDACAYVWRLQEEGKTFRRVHQLAGHDGRVRAIAGNYGRLATGSRDATVKVWDLRTGECLHTFTDHMNQVTSLYLSDECLISGSSDWIVAVYHFQPPAHSS